MNKRNVLTALVAAGILALLIFARALILPALFLKEDVKIQEAEDALRGATQELDALEAQKISLDKTRTDLDAQITRAQGDFDEKRAALSAVKEEGVEAVIEEARRGDAFKVMAIHLQEQSVQDGLVLSGSAEAGRRLEVRAEASGQVISDPLPSGMLVKKEDVLCKLDPGITQSLLDGAKATLETAQTSYNSNAELAARNLTSKAALQSARANLENAQSAYEEAQKQLENLEVRAPFDGYLQSDTAEIGTLMQPGSACVSIVSFDKVKLVGYASELQINGVEVGAPFISRINNVQDPLKGTLSFVATTADAETRAYRIEGTLDDPDASIRDGAAAEIVIALPQKKGHLVPQSALTLGEAGDLGVRVHENGLAKFYPVEFVRDAPEGVWVFGLPPEIDVITVGQEYVLDGQPIEIEYENQPAGSQS